MYGITDFRGLLQAIEFLKKEKCEESGRPVDTSTLFCLNRVTNLLFSYILLRLKSATNSFNRCPCFLNQESEHGRESDEDLAKLVADLQRRMEQSEVCSFFGKFK